MLNSKENSTFHLNITRVTHISHIQFQGKKEHICPDPSMSWSEEGFCTIPSKCSLKEMSGLFITYMNLIFLFLHTTLTKSWHFNAAPQRHSAQWIIAGIDKQWSDLHYKVALLHCMLGDDNFYSTHRQLEGYKSRNTCTQIVSSREPFHHRTTIFNYSFLY